MASGPVFPEGGTVAERVVVLLRSRAETVATAESLTGGLVGELLTGVPGASHAYLGGVITYATRLKSTLAGVAKDTLDRYGPVAALTAEQMAAGVAQLTGADWGVATTGVAGPEPQDGHPVGQVFVAVARSGDGVVRVHELALSGSRAAIRSQSAERALGLLEETLGMPSGLTGVE